MPNWKRPYTVAEVRRLTAENERLKEATNMKGKGMVALGRELDRERASSTRYQEALERLAKPSWEDVGMSPQDIARTALQESPSTGESE